MAFTGRPIGLVNYQFSYQQMRALSASVARQGRGASNAIRKAHTTIADQLQQAIRQELLDQIEHRGPRGIGARHQRGTALLDAIVSDKNRRVNLSGFVVGFLDEYYEGGVNKYYRNLEVGSRVFVGRTIYGVFQRSGGGLSPPTSDESQQIDPRFLQMKSRSGRAAGPSSFRAALVNGRLKNIFVPAIHIKNPIPAYHYFQEAEHSFIEQEVILDTTAYEEAFASLGLDFFARWMQAHGAAPKIASQSSLSFTRGSARAVAALSRQRDALEGG